MQSIKASINLLLLWRIVLMAKSILNWYEVDQAPDIPNKFSLLVKELRTAKEVCPVTVKLLSLCLLNYAQMTKSGYRNIELL